VLAGVPTLDLKLVEIAKIEGDRIAVSRGVMTTSETLNNQSRYADETIALWQQRWVTNDERKWTYAWFPDVRTRLDHRWCIMDYYATQLVSGHEDFNDKLHQFNLRGEAACRCGPPEQTPERLLFE